MVQTTWRTKGFYNFLIDFFALTRENVAAPYSS